MLFCNYLKLCKKIIIPGPHRIWFLFLKTIYMVLFVLVKFKFRYIVLYYLFVLFLLFFVLPDKIEVFFDKARYFYIRVCIFIICIGTNTIAIIDMSFFSFFRKLQTVVVHFPRPIWVIRRPPNLHVVYWVEYLIRHGTEVDINTLGFCQPTRLTKD